jgi:hypothetical protein
MFYPVLAATSGLSVYGIGAGVIAVALVGLWLVWKIAKFLLKVIIALFLLSIVATAAWWMLQH